MQRQSFFPVPLAIRIAPDTRAWLDAKSLEMRMSASALARKFIEEQARKDLVKGEAQDGSLRIIAGD